MILDLFTEPGEGPRTPPAVGDIVLTTRLAKLVTEVRPVESRAWHDRWRLDATNIGPRDHPDTKLEVRTRQLNGAHLFETGKYDKGESAADHARAHGYEVHTG